MMKCEFIKLAQEIKMPLLNDTVGDEDYAILESFYYVMDIDKSEFVKVVKAMGIEAVIVKHRRWANIRKAEEHYEAFLKYTKAKDELDEQQKAVERSKAIIANYEKHIRQS